LAACSGYTYTAIEANNFLGLVYFIQGHYRQAMDAHRRAMALLESEQRYEHFGEPLLPAVRCRTTLSDCLAEVGAFAEGIAVGEEGLHIAEASQLSCQPCVGLSECRPALPPPGGPASGADAARTCGGSLCGSGPPILFLPGGSGLRRRVCAVRACGRGRAAARTGPRAGHLEWQPGWPGASALHPGRGASVRRPP